MLLGWAIVVDSLQPKEYGVKRVDPGDEKQTLPT
jgi:hypothetical protein